MIPKIIHQIWLSDNPIPENYKVWIQSWKDKHPSWKYILWRTPLPNMICQNEFDQSQTWAQKADIMRYELTYQYGGIYADIDTECLKSFDDLINTNKPFLGYEIPDLPGISIIGSPEKHKTFEIILNKLKETFNPYDWPNMITGPRLLTKINFDDTDIIIYPEYYFYPYNWNEKDRENETFEDSYAIHKWECHWAKKYYEKNTSIIKNTFSKIYKDDVWNGGSGPGSSIENTKEYVEFLNDYIEENKIESVLDIGCGDWQFSHTINWKKYVGIDPVENVIIKNKLNYENISNNIYFTCSDAVPFLDRVKERFDLVIIKDVFCHLPTPLIQQIIDLIKINNYPKVLSINDYLPNSDYYNDECLIGCHRPIYLELHPFNLNIKILKCLTMHSCKRIVEII